MAKNKTETNWVNINHKYPKPRPKKHRLLGKDKNGFVHFIYHKGKKFYWDFDIANHYPIKEGEIISWCEIPN